MSDDPLDSIPEFDRISVKAVLVEDGEDATQALFDAGIYDPVVVPVVFGDAAPDMNFGDGVTPNLTGVLEAEAAEYAAATPTTQTARAQQTDENPAATKPATISLPPAFGLQPLAPVRRPGSRV